MAGLSKIVEKLKKIGGNQSRIIENQRYCLKENGEYDDLTKANAIKTAGGIRKKGGHPRVIKKSNGRYQIWVTAPYTFAEMKVISVKKGSSFFSKRNREHFKGITYLGCYGPSTGISYIMVINPNRSKIRPNNAFFKFSAKSGEFNHILPSETIVIP